MMRRWCTGLFVMTAAAGAGAHVRSVLGPPRQPSAGMASAISGALDRSAAGWNSGDLGQFMGIYLDSPRTTYATHTRYIHGPVGIRAVYADRFAPGAQRDSLRLVEVTVDSLSPVIANVMAFYVLSRRDSVTARGPTSLLMQRVGGTWYIVHDHSS
jgi:ketosteroid isomerase-like protein